MKSYVCFDDCVEKSYDPSWSKAFTRIYTSLAWNVFTFKNIVVINVLVIILLFVQLINNKCIFCYLVKQCVHVIIYIRQSTPVCHIGQLFSCLLLLSLIATQPEYTSPLDTYVDSTLVLSLWQILPATYLNAFSSSFVNSCKSASYLPELKEDSWLERCLKISFVM